MWAEEFLARYMPGSVGDVRLEMRVGLWEEEIPRAADEMGAELIALGWSQDLAQGRATVVRAVIERGRVPVLLVPVCLAAGGVGVAERSESWTS